MAARTDRFPLFDSLRGIAALAVVLLHTLYQPAVAARVGEDWWRFAMHLDVTVPIFFAISGFLLYRPFVAQRVGGRRVSVRAYGWRRLLRIAPAYWVSLTIVAVWFGMDALRENPLLYYGFAQIYDDTSAMRIQPQTWTLCVEVAFYLLLPAWALGMRALARRTGGGLLGVELWGLGALALIAVLWMGAALSHSDPGSAESMDLLAPLPGHLDHLAVGMFLAVLSVWVAERRSDPDRGRSDLGDFLDRVPGGAWWLAALGFWLLACYVAGPDGSPADPIDDRGYLLRHLFNGGVAICILMPAIFGDMRAGMLRRAIGTRPVLWIGTISFSIYLWHYAVVGQLAQWWRGGPETTAGWVVWTIIIYAGVILLAAVSYYTVERPAMRFGRRITARERRDDEPGAASVPAMPPPVEQVASEAATARPG